MTTFDKIGGSSGKLQKASNETIEKSSLKFGRVRVQINSAQSSDAEMEIEIFSRVFSTSIEEESQIDT